MRTFQGVLLLAALLLSIPAYALTNPQSSHIILNAADPLLNGGGRTISNSYNADITAIGGNITSLVVLLGGDKKLYVGHLHGFNGFIGPPTAAVISHLTARTEMFGEFILERVWQRDPTPYFSWNIDAIPAQLVSGFSVSFDTTPDEGVDIEVPSYQTPDGLLRSGKHTFYVLAFETGMGWQAENLLSFEIWVDITPPVITTIQPLPGSLVTRNAPPITAGIDDADSGMDAAAVTLMVNDGAVNAAYNSQTKTILYQPAGALLEGKNTVSLMAKDLAGNSAVKSWDFLVDTQPPVGTVKINGGETVTHSPYVTLTIDAKDQVTGIKSMYISNDGIFDTMPAHPYPYSAVVNNWPLSDSERDGVKRVYVKFVDGAGNISQTYSAEITLALTVPDTRIISGPASVTEITSAEFIFEATRPGCLFSYKLDNQQWSGWSSSTTAQFTGLSEGNHYFYVKGGYDVNGDGAITIEEEDVTPSSWVWTVKPAGILEKLKEKTLFWRR